MCKAVRFVFSHKLMGKPSYEQLGTQGSNNQLCKAVGVRGMSDLIELA